MQRKINQCSFIQTISGNMPEEPSGEGGVGGCAKGRKSKPQLPERKPELPFDFMGSG